MKPFLFGYYFDWQDTQPFTVLALVMAESPIEACTKYKSDSDRAYCMGEMNLVGGCVWEAREVLTIR